MLEALPERNALIAIGLASFAVLKIFSKQSELRRLPTAGFSQPLLSYITGLNFFINAHKLVQEGYDKFPGQAFKIANITQWIVVVSGDKLVNELKNAPEDQMSFLQAVEDIVASKFTMGTEVFDDPYHAGVAKMQLTRNLGDLCPVLQDEVIAAFDDAIPVPDSQWLKVRVPEMVQDVICRVSNRAFVGLPLCRDPDYRKLNINYTMDVMKDGTIINMFPDFLKPVVTSLFANAPKGLINGTKHLRPLVEERLAKIKEYGPDYPDKTADYLSWLMDEASPAEMTPVALTRRILATNFAAIHTSSMSFTHALYHLAAEPHYIQPLREEVEAVVREAGWTRNSISKMHKIDSFLKESQRINGLGCLVMGRKAVGKDFVFSDGTVIPVGTVVQAASLVHHDETVYDNANAFDGFRFSNLREQKGSGTIPMTAATPDFLAFGLGMHACPGRMFAVNELKMMLAHVVMHYDVKMEQEGVRPSNVWIMGNCIPNFAGEVMFRKRADE